MKTFNRSVKSIEAKRGLFFRIGLACSLLITFLAFEWRTPLTRVEVDPLQDWDLIEEEQMPVTYARREITFPPPEAKKRLLSNSPLTVDMQIVPDEVLVAATTDSILPDEIIPIFTTPEIDTTAETFYYGVERMPTFPGGESALKEYLENEIRYPEKAVRDGLNGSVWITFIVDESGNAINISCKYASDQIFSTEAIRVIEKMPLWQPGKQGGKHVKVIMTLPVKFSLK
ncbi:MAG: energy transducer TonB [Bacteroidota bacterium]|nr:energy transducer TonB [Bacteroidota bacterium]